MRQKKKLHLDKLLRSLYNQSFSIKSEIGFLREEVNEKKAMSLKHYSYKTPVNANVSVHAKVRNSTTFLKKMKNVEILVYLLL